MARLIIESLAERAASQHGIVSTADFAELEITSEQVRHRVDQRWLVRIGPRVFAVAGVVEYTTDHLRHRRAWVADDLRVHLVDPLQ